MSSTMINIPCEIIQRMVFQIFVKSAFYNFYISVVLLKHSNIVLFSKSFA